MTTRTERSEKSPVTTYDHEYAHEYAYEKDGAAIYRQSFATIRAEADLAGLPADVSQVAVRMIHACGMVDLVRDLSYTPAVVARAREALRAGAPVFTDVRMVASGVTRKRLPADNDVVCTLSDPAVPELARAAQPLLSCGGTGWRGRSWPSATRPPLSSGCWR
jgi:precorrin-8X/cobalt-precorrin-8 methylmutase